MFKLTTKNILYIVITTIVVLYLFPGILGGRMEPMADYDGGMEQFCGGDAGAGSGHQHAPECGHPEGSGCECGQYSGGVHTQQPENFSSCYRNKQIYLNSCDPDSVGSHADVRLERRWGKLYINIDANLPYALGGVFNTTWGSYHAFLVDTRTNRSINIGSLVRQGDRRYKLSTELLGEYSNYNEIWVYRQTEDYAPKLVLRGRIAGQQCSSL